jgi:predicted helicase
MARLTHLIRDVIVKSFETGQASSLLQGWRDAFARVLIADLDQPEKTGEFADMFAQTLAYGLFSARIMDDSLAFTRQEAQQLIPRTNPFLRDLFYQISGPQLSDEPYASFVEDLVALLANTDMNSVLADFGKRTRQEDPVVHFYETFLAAYDPELREARGVYYTPEPVVSYIVRSVDRILKARFACPEGLADTEKVTIRNLDPTLRIKGKRQMRKTTDSHRVLILDPATGTGTFLYAIIDLIRQNFMERENAGMWPGYVREHLLPRLFGFELLMAPYAVAHFKLALQLAGHDLPEVQRLLWAYDFATDERIQVFLTNALEGPHEYTGLPLFTQFLAEETAFANQVKQDLPILVVLGNPPYSGHSANKGAWINDLLKNDINDEAPSYYQVDGEPLGERNPKWLQDDYVKFIRWGQWRIKNSGMGVLAYITNHGYLDNPTFRGMRQSLMKTFNEIYVLNLHGNVKKKEISPDGSPDENVFDIQPGVAIGLFIKTPGDSGPVRVFHADLWGARQDKYTRLFSEDIFTTEWEELTPGSPYYLFIPQDITLLQEYKRGYKISEIMPVNAIGMNSHRDAFAIGFEPSTLRQRIDDFISNDTSNEDIRSSYELSETRDFSISEARRSLREIKDPYSIVLSCVYRPFDDRFVIFHQDILDRPRMDLNWHFINGPNLGLVTTRQTREPFAALAVSKICGQHKIVAKYDGSSIFPLYLYQNEDHDKQASFSTLFFREHPDKLGRVPNFAPEFISEIEKHLNMNFIPLGKGDLQETCGPEDVFHYIYSLLYSRNYRSRYADFLKIDFPRVHLTSSIILFQQLCTLGEQLTSVHLFESRALNEFITNYPTPGDDYVESRYPKYDEQRTRVYINKNQFFEGIPLEVWSFQIGGYKVCERWLKDRRGRQLTYDDLTHYQKIILAVKETIRLMDEIDQAIPGWPIS